MFENRHCGAGVPTVTNVPLPPLPPIVGDLVPPDLLDRMIQFAFAPAGSGAGRRAACRARYDFGGEVTQYPHVNER